MESSFRFVPLAPTDAKMLRAMKASSSEYAPDADETAGAGFDIRRSQNGGGFKRRGNFQTRRFLDVSNLNLGLNLGAMFNVQLSGTGWPRLHEGSGLAQLVP